jgi:hypothetical protein
MFMGGHMMLSEWPCDFVDAYMLTSLVWETWLSSESWKAQIFSKTLPLTRVLQHNYFNVSLSPWLKLPILSHLVQGVFGHPWVLTRPILMLSTDLFMYATDDIDLHQVTVPSFHPWLWAPPIWADSTFAADIDVLPYQTGPILPSCWNTWHLQGNSWFSAASERNIFRTVGVVYCWLAGPVNSRSYNLVAWVNDSFACSAS